GFGADLGAEKFLDIKCRLAGLEPDAVVLVATVRALKMNGGVTRAELGAENVAALRDGCANLGRHIENLRGYGLPVVVAINHFTTDTEAEVGALQDYCAEHGVRAVLCKHWAEGGAGAEDLARAVVEMAEAGAAFAPLYPDAMPLRDKIETICKRIYRAEAVEFLPHIIERLNEWQAAGHGHLPVCMAKTQYSFSADPTARGAPEGFTIPVREVRLAAGAGFVVAICGDIMTMPGLPREPAALRIGLDGQRQVQGLF
ncbi:formate--tetrahydrofolate ligase, partial [Paracoccus sp. DMF]|uniref:formate--tetrahydrofolate ligase n=1 Tax=Paracoccus sp. DMF TaxID=400837 RepID=UPI0021E43F39